MAGRLGIDKQTIFNRVRRGELSPSAYLLRGRNKLTPLFKYDPTGDWPTIEIDTEAEAVTAE